jgi:hypothetical protein
MSWTEDDLAAHYARLKTPQEGAAVAAPSNDSEALIEAECTKFMEEDGWRALRTDPVSDKSRGKGFGELGMADHLYMRIVGSLVDRENEFCCELLWVEFKARKGKVSKHQTAWHARERARGFQTWIASVDFGASVIGFKEYYAESNLMRRARWW